LLARLARRRRLLIASSGDVDQADRVERLLDVFGVRLAP
jgi:hypothetical protein